MLRRISSAAALLILAALLVAPTGAAAAGTTTDREGDAIVVVSGDVTVPRDETVEGVFVVSGDVTILGQVSGDVVVLSGDVLLAGTVDGNLYTASGTARLTRSAEVGGDVRYADERPLVSLDARVHGEVEEIERPNLGEFFGIGWFLIWLAVSISAALLGVLLILIGPRAADAIDARSRERVGPTIAIGIAIAIALPVAIAIAGVTLVGLPLALVLLLALLPLGAIAYTATAWVLGRRVLGPPRHRVLSFLVGLAILRALALVPILSLFVGLVAVILGFGLIGAAIGAARGGDEDPAGGEHVRPGADH